MLKAGRRSGKIREVLLSVLKIRQGLLLDILSCASYILRSCRTEKEKILYYKKILNCELELRELKLNIKKAESVS